jgi:Cdc6-like AAA superfamily ATPase
MTDAVYIDQALDIYKGNPLIEALPPIAEDVQELVKLLKNYIDAPKDSSTMSDALRYHAIGQLSFVVQPRAVHIHLERMISVLLRKGYVARNPLSPTMVRHLHNPTNVSDGFSTSASTASVIGLSGMGKSTAIERVLSLYPQTISHTSYQGSMLTQTQVVWLKLDCPPDGSLKTLCSSFFRKLGEALGDASISAINPRIGTTQLVQKMAQLAKTYSIGLIVIDELQNLTRKSQPNRPVKKASNKVELINFFVNLVNDVGIPFLFVGTYSALQLISSDLKTARRVTGLSHIEFSPFKKNDPEWHSLLKRLWKYQWCRETAPLTPEIEDTLFQLTQGVTAVLAVLLQAAQHHAISTGEEKLTASLFIDAFDRYLITLKPALHALRDGGYKTQHFEDLLPTADQIAAMCQFDPFNAESVLEALDSHTEEDIAPPAQAEPQRRKRTVKKSDVDAKKIDVTQHVVPHVLDFLDSGAKR